jgi:type IV pilus assembly protein PilC
MSTWFFQKYKIPTKTLSLFTHQLATLLEAGMPLLPSLLMLEQQQSHTRFKKVISQIMASLHEGKSFSHALGEHPSVFSDDYQSMVKAGERGGILGDVLQQVAKLQDRRQQLHQKLVSILLYPMIVLTAACFIIGLLLFFVVPKFEMIFLEMFSEKTLPPLTQAILNWSHHITNHPTLLIMTGIFLLGGISFFSKTTLGRLWRDQLVLRTPYFQRLFQKNILARFARTVGTLLSNGIPLLQALELGKMTSGSHSVDQLFQEIHDSIQSGHAMAASLHQNTFFPPMVVNMIEVGEATGQLPKMLLHLADFYEEELQTHLERLLTLLEPATILLLALTVGIIIIALFLPLVTMMGEVGN